MAKHIQGKDGKMKGSIGDGKNKVPTAGLGAPAVDPDAAPDLTRLTTAERRYREKIRELAVTTDTELAEKYNTLFDKEQRVEIHLDRLHYSLNHERERYSRGSRWVKTGEEAITEARAAVDNPDTPSYKQRELQETLNRLDEDLETIRATKTRIQELNAIYRQHRWTRAFLVPGGHVHSSMDCSTCNRNGNNTKFVWLPQYSGGEENDIVEDAGERACTVCYPSAPVDVLQRPTRIFSDEERQQIEAAEERRAQRDAARSARAAKAPTASGEPLTVHVGTRQWRNDQDPQPVYEEFKTERTALTYATDIIAAQQSGSRFMAPYNADESRYEETKEAIIGAVAEKRGVDPSEVLAEVTAKAEAKVRKFNREVARHRG